MLMWFGLRTSENKLAVYVGQQALIDAMHLQRAGTYKVLARLVADGLVVPLHSARAGTRQRYQLIPERKVPSCGQHPGCHLSRVHSRRPLGSTPVDPSHAHQGLLQWTPNGVTELERSAVDTCRVVDITDWQMKR